MAVSKDTKILFATIVVMCLFAFLPSISELIDTVYWKTKLSNYQEINTIVVDLHKKGAINFLNNGEVGIINSSHSIPIKDINQYLQPSVEKEILSLIERNKGDKYFGYCFMSDDIIGYSVKPGLIFYKWLIYTDKDVDELFITKYLHKRQNLVKYTKIERNWYLVYIAY